MREIVDSERVLAFLKALGVALRTPTTVYLTGGTSAVVEGWRDSTMDLDLKFVPDSEAFNVIPRLKEELRVNVELASPDQFLPELPNWRDRSPLVEQYGAVQVRHFDFYSQALTKLERGFGRDIADVREMVGRGFVDTGELTLFAREIAPELNRFPAVDPVSFLRAVDEFVAESGHGDE